MIFSPSTGRLFTQRAVVSLRINIKGRPAANANSDSIVCNPDVCSHCAVASLQHWPVFKEVTEVFILVPALLGLKGNLEMTLASRLSTAVRQVPIKDAQLKVSAENSLYSGRRSS